MSSCMLGFAIAVIDAREAERTLQDLAEIADEVLLPTPNDDEGSATRETPAMKFVDEFRNPEQSQALLRRIKATATRVNGC
jgi:hypothetical protein